MVNSAPRTPESFWSGDARGLVERLVSRPTGLTTVEASARSTGGRLHAPRRISDAPSLRRADVGISVDTAVGIAPPHRQHRAAQQRPRSHRRGDPTGKARLRQHHQVRPGHHLGQLRQHVLDGCRDDRPAVPPAAPPPDPSPQLPLRHPGHDHRRRPRRSRDGRRSPRMGYMPPAQLHDPREAGSPVRRSGEATP